MDEDVEAEKIRLLEERMRLFESDAAVTVPFAPGTSVHSSEDESSSDESDTGS